MEKMLTEEEKNKIISIVDFYSSPMSSCSDVSEEFASGYNYAFQKLKEKIKSI